MPGLSAMVRQVLEAVAADEQVVERVVGAARGNSPEVARLPAEENRRHIAFLLSEGIAHLERGGSPDDGDFSAALALGADRAAQGVSMAGLLRGVHAGRTELIRAAVELARSMGVDDGTILDFMIGLDHYVGAVERHIVSGYHTAELQLARTARDLNAQVLRRLLVSGEFPDASELARAGLRADGRYHCVVSGVTDPSHARTLEQRLHTSGGVYGLVEGRLAGLTHVPPVSSDDLLVVSPATVLKSLRALYSLCAKALVVASGGGVRMLTDLAGETALAAFPALAGVLADSLLGQLDPKSSFHHEMVATALCYLDHGGRLGATAAALHIHTNTVRYRLDRLVELTGVDLGDTPDAARSHVLTALHTWWALRSWTDRGAR
ncbi:PucR family transcriptional regulator [Lentzea sp. NPDC060358]|uniref:PucR family transcriptional regulator n=1 Tax=Lentzea sp. NPDC060358 TaxID=3347103 RepID=UPI00365B05D2